MMFMKDSREGQPRRTAGACAPIVQGIAVVLAATFEIGNWNMSMYCMYTRANSYVDRLEAEGARNSASWLMSCVFYLLFL